METYLTALIISILCNFSPVFYGKRRRQLRVSPVSKTVQSEIDRSASREIRVQQIAHVQLRHLQTVL